MFLSSGKFFQHYLADRSTCVCLSVMFSAAVIFIADADGTASVLMEQMSRVKTPILYS